MEFGGVAGAKRFEIFGFQPDFCNTLVRGRCRRSVAKSDLTDLKSLIVVIDDFEVSAMSLIAADIARLFDPLPLAVRFEILGAL